MVLIYDRPVVVKPLGWGSRAFALRVGDVARLGLRPHLPHSHASVIPLFPPPLRAWFSPNGRPTITIPSLHVRPIYHGG
jgi:hypothetical protein